MSTSRRIRVLSNVALIPVLLFAACSATAEVGSQPSTVPAETTPAQQLPLPTPTLTAERDEEPTALQEDSDTNRSEDVPGCRVVTADPGIGLEAPTGAQRIAVELHPRRAVGGQLARGDSVAIVNTSSAAAGVLQGVAVLDYEVVIDYEDPDLDPFAIRPIRLYLAVEQGQVASFMAGCQAESVVLAASMADGGYAVHLELTGENALAGAVRPGDFVRILAGDSPIIPASVEVLQVQVALDDSTLLGDGVAEQYSVLMRLQVNELAPLLIADETAELRLARP